MKKTVLAAFGALFAMVGLHPPIPLLVVIPNWIR